MVPQANAIGSAVIIYRYHPNIELSDRYLIDINSIVLAICDHTLWHIHANLSSQGRIGWLRQWYDHIIVSLYHMYTFVIVTSVFTVYKMCSAEIRCIWKLKIHIWSLWYLNMVHHSMYKLFYRRHSWRLCPHLVQEVPMPWNLESFHRDPSESRLLSPHH